VREFDLGALCLTAAVLREAPRLGVEPLVGCVGFVRAPGLEGGPARAGAWPDGGGCLAAPGCAGGLPPVMLPHRPPKVEEKNVFTSVPKSRCCRERKR
jgi:hypothetical protein